MAQPTTLTENQSVQLYAHTKCKEWGLAIVAWTRGAHKAYQFEDGKLRVFSAEHCTMFEEVDAPADRAATLTADLKRQHGVLAATTASAERAPPLPEQSFDGQVQILKDAFPGGFQDPAWLKDRRGSGGGRGLKRHRDAAHAAAQEVLGRDVLDQALQSEGFLKVHGSLVSLLESTDLIAKKLVDPLRALPSHRARQFTARLFDLLHGEGDPHGRFDRYLSALAPQRPATLSWELATVLPALFQPSEHVLVRPLVFRKQARWMAPRLILPVTPDGLSYIRLRDMARAVGVKLTEMGVPPTDLLDVHDFMQLSLKPAKAPAVATPAAR